MKFSSLQDALAHLGYTRRGEATDGRQFWAQGENHQLPRENLGDVLQRSMPKTLPELLAGNLGVDLNEQPDPEPEPEVDTAEPEPEPSKLPPLPDLPSLAESLSTLQRHRR